MRSTEEYRRPVRQQRSEQGAHGLNERLAAHFLRRLRRESEKLALTDAVEAGILRRDTVETDGPSLSIYRHGPKAGVGMSLELATATVSRHQRRLSSENPRPVLGSSGLSFESAFETFEETTRHADHAELCEPTSSKQDRPGELVLLRAIHAAAEPPNASDVATLLLIGNAAQCAFPILSVAEQKERLPRKLVQASQLDLACGTLNATIVGRTIEAVTGEPPSPGRLDDIDFGRLGLGDLAIAIRPGISADSAADTLQRLARDDAGGGSQDAVSKPQPKEKPSSSGSSTARRGADPGSGTDIVMPVPPSQTRVGHPAPTVESLSGYGEASQWALQVRDELPMWYAGELCWEELSTKILLSGPPGVGKTLFARALCNTLQIPLLSTSVARWLEPSHLGDVLKRIGGAFREAEAQKPCILFIDEFDGIGRRVDFTRDYADYWNTVVNCGLEMLDGVARTSGVIVVCATNNPEVIDPALLRSGRIETRVEIPLPDMAARLAILRHYLGKDAETVAASVPHALPEDDLRNVLQEGFESMPDDIYRELVAAAIPGSSEASAL